jgi:hypothetical protein
MKKAESGKSVTPSLWTSFIYKRIKKIALVTGKGGGGSDFL